MGELCENKKAKLVGISFRYGLVIRGIVVGLPVEKNAD
jgi:hypothetical protein